jgi:hypothetical protein
MALGAAKGWPPSMSITRLSARLPQPSTISLWKRSFIST